MRPQQQIALLAAALASLLLASAAQAQPSVLKIKDGTAGCTSEAGDQGCADGIALHGSGSIVVSPDGENAYLASQDSDSVVIFNRNPDTGRLSQKWNGTAGCIFEPGSAPPEPAGACAEGKALDAAETVAISPDGANVYVASRLSDAVAVFDRDPANGRLVQQTGLAGCVSETGSGGQCADGTALDGASTVTVSPDGANVYVASRFSDAVAVLDRNPLTGTLTQKPGTAGCISDDGTGGACADGTALDLAIGVVVSPDGESVYAAARNSSAVTIFDRNPLTGALTEKAGTAGCVSEDGTAGACVDGRALLGAGSVTVSSDGANVYAAAEDGSAISIFDRDPTGGGLTQKPGTAGCIAQSGGAIGCAQGRDLFSTRSVAVSPDGLSAYAAAIEGDSVTVFDRDPGSGGLTQLSPPDACINQDGVGGCALGRALDGAEAVAVSPDGDNVYAAAALADSVVSFDRGRAPITKITKAPKAKVRTDKKATDVTVAFKSEPGATFRCRLDDANYEACDSPWTTRAAAKRGKGKQHQIRIKATDVGGNVETKPASTDFRVIRR